MRHHSDDQRINPLLAFWEKRRRVFISAFIIFNVVAIGFGSSQPVAQQGLITRFFTPYLVWTRLLQSWRLFVPTPRKTILSYRAEIVFRDGSRQTWQRPYPPNWDFFPRHLAYQFQKWDLAADYLERPKLAELLWMDLAHYLEKLYADPVNPPQKIVFYRSQADVPPPLENGYAMSDMRQVLKTDQEIHTYSVTEERLLQ